MLAAPAIARLRERPWLGGGTLIGAAALLVAGLVGAVLAYDIRLGFALLFLSLYFLLAAFELRLALVAWVPTVFFEGVPALNTAGKAIGGVLVVGWLASLLTSARARAALASHRRLAAAMTALLVWVTVTLAWAADAPRGFSGLWQWWAIAIVFLIVATCIATERSLRLFAACFVAGGVLAIVWSIVDQTGVSATSTRLGAAAGDPNSLAAGLLPGVVLAAGLIATTRSKVARWLLVVAIAILSAGIVATQSRGALVAAVVAITAALVLFKRSRGRVVAVVIVAAAVAIGVFAVQPEARQRATTLDTSGAGRDELWQVAWRVFEDHPVVGVGVNNFGSVAGQYVRDPGVLTRVDRLAESPKSVHNVYLETLAETGIVGLALLLFFFGGCVHAGIRAGRQFDALGLPQLANLARAIAVATVGMLVTIFFISAPVDRRLWIVCALGPAALLVAQRRPRPGITAAAAGLPSRSSS